VPRTASPARLEGEAETPGIVKKEREIRPLWLGRRPYEEVLALQERLLDEVVRGHRGNTLLLLEHEPVVTFGRLVNEADLRLPKDALAEVGIDVVETGRGGNATFHGPGQLVAYPIFDLNPDRCDVRKYVADLASVMIRLLAAEGVGAGMLHGAYLGVWVDPSAPGKFDENAVDLAQIGAIGVRLSRFVTMHGFALNLTTDLETFARVIWPCGIADRGITSLQALEPAGGESAAAGRDLAVTTWARRAATMFGEVFGWPAAELLDVSELPLSLV
jgi:lipoyl(octanoyl) transferase